MFTTTTPGEHEFSIVSRGAIPLKDAPYPTDVGTAIIGFPINPETTLGKTPSMPATIISTFASDNFSLFFNNLCKPATPTSYSLSTLLPIASATTAASSATLISDVPALKIRILPFLICLFFLLIMIVLEILLYWAFLMYFLTSINISSVALVARTSALFSANFLTISATCPVVLFWQKITSGKPFLKD